MYGGDGVQAETEGGGDQGRPWTMVHPKLRGKKKKKIGWPSHNFLAVPVYTCTYFHGGLETRHYMNRFLSYIYI